jgi:hypothetical protein
LKDFDCRLIHVPRIFPVEADLLALIVFAEGYFEVNSFSLKARYGERGAGVDKFALIVR